MISPRRLLDKKKETTAARSPVAYTNKENILDLPLTSAKTPTNGAAKTAINDYPATSHAHVESGFFKNPAATDDSTSGNNTL